MNFERYLLQQIKMHPSVQPQDLVKLCFQAAYGGEHLLEDLAGAKAYFFQEHAAVEAADIPLYECISDDVCRVNQGAWKYREMPGEWLFEMFADSAGVRGKEGTRAPLRNGVRSDFFSQYLETAGQAAAEGYTSFGPADWESYLAEYRRKGMGAVHHSEIYRKREKPAYRIVDSWYKRLFPILELAVKRRSPGKVCVIALMDGQPPGNPPWPDSCRGFWTRRSYEWMISFSPGNCGCRSALPFQGAMCIGRDFRRRCFPSCLFQAAFPIVGLTAKRWITMGNA